MDNLLVVNGVTFPVPDGGITISYDDNVNVYESESGEKTIEVIRENVCSIDYNYKGLIESRLIELCEALKAVNTVQIKDIATGTIKTKQMKADKSRVKAKKVYYRHGVSVWGLSFGLEEM